MAMETADADIAAVAAVVHTACVAVIKVEQLGRARGPEDGSRRYTPMAMTFDTRATLLDFADGPEVEPATAELNRNNKARLREGLIHEFGTAAYEQKLENFKDLGPAPWSVVALHNVYLNQVRDAFTFGTYYPALVGAGALGERILNHLVLTLRGDYADHPATEHVATRDTFDRWDRCIHALEGWGVLTDDVKRNFKALKNARNRTVHYNTDLDTGDARTAALEAIRLLAGIVEKLFNPHGTGPKYVTGPIGRAYVRLEAESDPFIRRFIIPASALVSPRFRFVPNGVGHLDIYDDPDYGVDQPPLTDEEFADPARATPQVEYPF